MIALDPIINEFISGNWLAISIAMTLLKGVALLSPTAKDNKIHELLSGLFGQIRGGK
jgi:hypothetical protein